MKKQMFFLLGLGTITSFFALGCASTMSMVSNRPDPTFAALPAADYTNNIVHKRVYVKDHGTNRNQKQITWSAFDKDNGSGKKGALRNFKVYPGKTNEWNIKYVDASSDEDTGTTFSSFSIIVTNTSEWSVVYGRTSDWQNSLPSEPLPSGYGVIDSMQAGGKKDVIRLRYTGTQLNNTSTYFIVVPAIGYPMNTKPGNPFKLLAKPFWLSTDYQMIDATVVYNGDAIE